MLCSSNSRRYSPRSFLRSLPFLALLLSTPLPSNGATDNVSQQIARLTDADPAIRKNAAEVLGRFQDARAVDPLIAALKDGLPDVRRSAAIALGSLKDQRAVMPLIGCLRDDDPTVAEFAAWSLAKLDDRRAVVPLIDSLSRGRGAIIALVAFKDSSTSPLIAALRNPDPQIRARSAEILGMIADPQAIDPLLATLKDSSPEVRESTAGALSVFNDPRVTTALLDVLHDPDPQVRVIATRMIDRLKAPPVLDSLVAQLNDPNPQVSRESAASLGRSGDPRAVKPLVTAAANPVLRWTAYNSLGKIQDPAAADALVKLLEAAPDSETKNMAISALAMLKSPRAVPALISTLADPDISVRIGAANALGEIKDPRAVRPLITALKESNDYATGSYISALSRIGSPAVEPLIGLLADPSVRGQAVGALAGTKDPRAVEPLIALLKIACKDPHPSEGGVLGTIATPAPPGQVQCLPALSVLSALSQLGDPRALAPIVDAFKYGTERRDMLGSDILAFGEPAVAPLIPLLQSPDPELRRSTARVLAQFAVSEGIHSSAANALLSPLHAKDIPAIAGGYIFYVSLGEDGSQQLLIKALNQFGDQAMAEYFLNCGDVSLEDATRAWAGRHIPGMKQHVYGVLWGRMPQAHPQPDNRSAKNPFAP